MTSIRRRVRPGRLWKSPQGYNDQALTFYGALMMWTWWQRDDFASPSGMFREVAAQAPVAYPTVRAALALFDAESGATE